MATLQIHLPDSGAVTHELNGAGVISVGWAPDNTIQIKDVSISGHHAQLVHENNRYCIKDLGSTNKCWLNGVAVAEAELHDADNIRFGNVECVFRVSDAGGKQ